MKGSRLRFRSIALDRRDVRGFRNYVKTVNVGCILREVYTA